MGEDAGAQAAARPDQPAQGGGRVGRAGVLDAAVAVAVDGVGQPLGRIEAERPGAAQLPVTHAGSEVRLEPGDRGERPDAAAAEADGSIDGLDPEAVLFLYRTLYLGLLLHRGTGLDGPDPDTDSEIDLVLGLAGGASDDVLYDQAVAIVAKDRKCSTSYIQRKLSVGYNKAAKLVELTEEAGVVSQANHVGKREVLVPER